MSDEIKILNGRKYQKKNGQWFDIGPADTGTPQIKSINGRNYEKKDGQWYDIGESKVEDVPAVKKKDGGTDSGLAGIGGQSTSQTPKPNKPSGLAAGAGTDDSADAEFMSLAPEEKPKDIPVFDPENIGKSLGSMYNTGNGLQPPKPVNTDIFLRSDYTSKPLKSQEGPNYPQRQAIDEVGLKIMNSAVTGEDIATLSKVPDGDKYISALVQKFAPELGGTGYGDDVFRSDVKREKLAKAILEKTREAAVQRQGEYFTSLDEGINEVIQNYELENITASGGTGGAGVDVSKKKLGLVDLSDPKKIGELMAEVQNAERLVGKDGKPVKGEREKLLKALSEKLAFIKANQPISEDILSQSDQIKKSIAGIDLTSTRVVSDVKNQEEALADLDKSVGLANIRYEHIMSGLNYLKDASPGYYDIVMRAIKKKGKMAEADYEKIGLIGQEISNQKKFISSAQNKELIGAETSLDYTTYQQKKQQYAGAIGEYLKASGLKNIRQFSEKQIRQAAISLGLTDQEVINDLADEEGIMFYNAIPKSGWREMIASGLMQPFDAIKKTIDSWIMSPEDFHLKHQQFDVGIGGQKVAGKNGEMSTRLPSDRGNVWYDALEGFGQFIPQVLLARGIGSPIAGAARSATSMVPRATLTAAQDAAIVNYGGTFISTYLQEYGSSFQDLLQKTGDPATARSGGAINAIAASGFELFLPDTKIADKAAGIFRKSYAGDIIDIIKKGGDPSDIARKGRGVIEKFVSETLGVAKQEVKEEVGTNIVNYLTEAIFSPKTAADRNLGEEMLQTAKATAVSMLIPSVLGGAGSSVNKDFTVNGLHAAAINLKEYKASLEKALLNDQISQKEYNDGIKMLSTHRQSIRNAPFESSVGKILSKSERLEYAYQETVVKALTEQLEAATSEVTKEDIKAKIAKAQSVQKDILAVKIEAKGEEQVKADPEYKSRTISIDEEHALNEEGEEWINESFEGEPGDISKPIELSPKLPGEEGYYPVQIDENELTDNEQNAIEVIAEKDFSGSAVEPYTKVIQDANSTNKEKKEALKGLSDQLLATATSEKIGTALGQKLSIIIEDLGYDAPVESKEVKDAALQQPITKPELIKQAELQEQKEKAEQQIKEETKTAIPETAEKKVEVDLTTINYKQRYPKTHEVVFVDPSKILDRLSKDDTNYDVQNKKNQIGNRIQKAKEFILNYATDKRWINPKSGERSESTNVEFEPSIAQINNGKISFEDGRHRILAAKELGISKVGIEVPKEQANLFKKEFEVNLQPNVSDSKPAKQKAALVGKKIKIGDKNWVVQNKKGQYYISNGEVRVKIDEAGIRRLSEEKPKPTKSETKPKPLGVKEKPKNKKPVLGSSKKTDAVKKLQQSAGLSKEAAKEVFELAKKVKNGDITKKEFEKQYAQIVAKDRGLKVGENNVISSSIPDVTDFESADDLIKATKEFEQNRKDYVERSAQDSVAETTDAMKLDGRVQVDKGVVDLLSDQGQNTLLDLLTGGDRALSGAAAAFIAIRRLIINKNTNELARLFSKVGVKLKIINDGGYQVLNARGGAIGRNLTKQQAEELAASQAGPTKIKGPIIMAAVELQNGKPAPTIVINAASLGDRVAHLGGEKNFFNWLEAALWEEVIHLASYKVSNEAELTAVGKSLTEEQRRMVEYIYGRQLSDFEAGSEYVRMMVQESVLGTTTEMFRIQSFQQKIKDVVSKIIKYLKSVLGTTPKSRVAAKVVKNLEDYIRSNVENAPKEAITKRRPAEKEKPKITWSMVPGTRVMRIMYNNRQFFIREQNGAFYEVYQPSMGRWEPVQDGQIEAGFLGYNITQAKQALDKRAEDIGLEVSGKFESDIIFDGLGKDKLVHIDGGVYLYDDKSLIELSDFDGAVHIKFISSLDKGKGHGKEMLNKITEIADKNGIVLKLSAIPVGDKGIQDKERLVKFYEDAGFEVSPQYGMKSREKILEYVKGQKGESVAMARVPKNTNIEVEPSLPDLTKSTSDSKYLEAQNRVEQKLASVPKAKKVVEETYEESVDKYRWFIVDFDTNRAVEGYEYPSDAKDALKEYEGNYKIVNLRTLKRYGIEDPRQKWQGMSSEAGPWADEDSNDLFNQMFGGRTAAQKALDIVNEDQDDDVYDPLDDFSWTFSSEIMILQDYFLTALKRAEGGYEQNPAEYERAKLLAARAEWDMRELISEVFAQHGYDKALNYFLFQITNENIPIITRQLALRLLIERFEGVPDLAINLKTRMDKVFGTFAGAMMYTRKDFGTLESGKPSEETTGGSSRPSDKGLWARDLSQADSDAITNAVQGGEEILADKKAIEDELGNNFVSEEAYEQMSLMVDEAEQRYEESVQALKEVRSSLLDVKKSAEKIDKELASAKSAEAKARIANRYGKEKNPIKRLIEKINKIAEQC